MKKLAFLSMLIVGLMGDCFAVTRPSGRGNLRSGGNSNATTQTTTAARAATNSRVAPRVATQSTTAKTVNRGRAATVTTAKPVVAARAATTQKVVGTGTKVAGAAKNIVVSEECQQKYEGCMDAFCMLDNETGGRCICSDKNAEFDAILAEIEKLDQQSYQMATFGVEKIEMGDDADAAIAKANAAAQSVIDDADSDAKKARRTLDLSMWDVSVDFDNDENIFGTSAMSPIEGKEGDALHRAAANLCVEQIPECSSEIQLLQMMYAQRIKSDCAAYENSLKQQKNSSAQKLATAERALREAALDQLRTANKYDLGQCAVQFKKCMQSTGGCGDDFSGCAAVVAMDNTYVNQEKAKKTKNYQVKGAVTTIEISASTYDTLLAKKPLCESVTKSCVAVADQVWDTFLRDVAPQVKNAELIAEDKARQDCIGNISSCFQKACKDTIDPNDPDGSYDMCLSRPGTMLNVCKIPLNACGIDASSESAAAESNIWDFVVARLASMRVDSCTTEVKSCLQSDDRCGKDYTKCIGLDTDTIIRMCPYDKLVGCQRAYNENEIRGDAVYDELSRLVQGIMLDIDNSFLVECQNAVDEAMIRVCGDTENCNSLAVDENVGARSLEYKICKYKTSGDDLTIDYSNCRSDASLIMDSELGRGGNAEPLMSILDGTIYWESVSVDEDGRLGSIDDYLGMIGDTDDITDAQKQRISAELAQLQASINSAIDTIEADPKVQFCISGREVQGLTRTNEEGASTRTKFGDKSAARFPALTKQMRSIIASSALKIAKDNYYKKYDELNEKMLQDYAEIGERMAEIQGENAKDARREIARQACVNFAEASSLPKSSEPPKSAFGKIMAGVVVVGAAVAIPFTLGASATLAVGALSITATSTAAVTAGTIGVAAAGATVAGIGLLGNAGSGKANGEDSKMERELIGSKSLNQWNYKENITSTFEWETLKCNRCTRTQQCAKEKNPMFGNKYCKDWADATEECVETQF